MALQLQTAADGVVRDAHYVTPTGATDPVRVLLTEPQMTNLLLWSQDATQTAWTKTDTTPTANAAISPTGAANADLLVEGSAGTANLHQAVTVASGASVAASRWLKRDNHDWVLLEIADNAAPTTNFVRRWVNVATGALGSATTGGAGVAGTAVVPENFGNGWWRFGVVGSLTGITSYRISSRSASADASTTRVNGARRLEFGRQGGVGVVVSTYTPTVGATASRNADVLYWTVAGLVPQELTVYARIVNLGVFAPTGSRRRVLHIGGANAGAGVRLQLNCSGGGAGDRLEVLYTDNTTQVVQSAISSPTLAQRDIAELRGVLSASNTVLSGISVNNNAEVSDGPSAASGPAAAFGEARVYAFGATGQTDGPVGYLNIGVFRGTRDRAYCRANTGVV
jgi:hypothetical protein